MGGVTENAPCRWAWLFIRAFASLLGSPFRCALPIFPLDWRSARFPRATTARRSLAAGVMGERLLDTILEGINWQS
jgi:hypothetical protein